MVAIICREISTHPFSVHPHKHALGEIKCCKFYEQTLSILVSIIICLRRGGARSPSGFPSCTKARGHASHAPPRASRLIASVVGAERPLASPPTTMPFRVPAVSRATTSSSSATSSSAKRACGWRTCSARAAAVCAARRYRAQHRLVDARVVRRIEPRARQPRCRLLCHSRTLQAVAGVMYLFLAEL